MGILPMMSNGGTVVSGMGILPMTSDGSTGVEGGAGVSPANPSPFLACHSIVGDLGVTPAEGIRRGPELLEELAARVMSLPPLPHDRFPTMR